MYKILLAIVLITTSLLASEVKKSILWQKDFKSGIKEAKKENKPVLFVYSRHTCKYCVVLEKNAFSDKRVIDALNKDFISIISYTDENDYTPRELLSSATPTLWFLKPDGHPMFQPLMGAVDKKSFLEALHIVKKEFDKVNEKREKK
ncbi:MAG: DUF255 domain-containing protein [Sulfurimonas sp.]|nr:DUF255 domain-containing protein [Sulfurimonas sp.]